MIQPLPLRRFSSIGRCHSLTQVFPFNLFENFHTPHHLTSPPPQRQLFNIIVPFIYVHYFHIIFKPVQIKLFSKSSLQFFWFFIYVFDFQNVMKCHPLLPSNFVPNRILLAVGQYFFAYFHAITAWKVNILFLYIYSYIS